VTLWGWSLSLFPSLPHHRHGFSSSNLSSKPLPDLKRTWIRVYALLSSLPELLIWAREAHLPSLTPNQMRPSQLEPKLLPGLQIFLLRLIISQKNSTKYFLTGIEIWNYEPRSDGYNFFTLPVSSAFFFR
jgi:hypothetical protein